MGFVGSLLGGGATGGGNFSAQGPSAQEMAQAQASYQEQLANQQKFLTQLQGQNGIQNQSNVFNQLQGVASGTGPNPAQAMLSNATGANVANQAALMAGQRGASSNVGLMARQAGQQGGALQQQAVGQGAAMQAQQGLGALGQMGGLSTQQVGQQQSAQQAMLQASLANQQALMGAQGSKNQANAGVAQGAMQQQGQIAGGLMSGLGAGLMMLNHGGQVPGYADGGMPELNTLGKSSFFQKLSSGLGENLEGQKSAQPGLQSGSFEFGQGVGQSVGKGFGNLFASKAGPTMAGGSDTSDIMNQPTMMAAHGGSMDYRQGGKVPGQAKVSGDSLHNDTQPAMLSPKEIVLPRSVTLHPNAPEKAAEFVRAILAKQGMKKV